MLPKSFNQEFVYKKDIPLVLKRFSLQISRKIKQTSYIESYLNFNGNGYSLKQLKIFLQNVITIQNITQINIADLLNQNMIKWIQHIDFTILQEIWITNSNISSIEQLPLLKFPQLRSLRLKTNKITNITSIRKMHIPNILFLNLDVNYFNDVSPITQLFAPNLRYLYLLGKNDKKNTIFIDSVFKLQTEPLQYFNSGDVRAFLSQGKIEMKRKKYSKLNW